MAAISLVHPWEFSLLNLLFLRSKQPQTWLINVHSQLLNPTEFLKYLQHYHTTDTLIFESKIPVGETLRQRLEAYRTAGGNGKYVILALPPNNKGQPHASSVLQSFWKDGLLGIQPQIILVLSLSPITIGKLKETNIALINLDCIPSDKVVPAELQFFNEIFPGRVTKLEKPKTKEQLKKKRELEKQFERIDDLKKMLEKTSSRPTSWRI